MKDVEVASTTIHSILFRPPYGRIKKSQIEKIKQQYQIIMWSVLSGDFDTNISPQQCLNNVIKNANKGSIIVFHDSAKAFERLQFALPEALKYFADKGFQFKSLPIVK